MAFRLNISHWVQMGIAAIVAAGIISVYPVIEREMNRNKPIDEWFNIRQLEVAPITPLGSFPVVVFDRTVGQEFVADWSMEIQSVEGDEFKMFCRASGIKKYEVNEVLNNQGELISWFTENFPKCEHIKDTLGRYRIVVKWKMDRGNSYYDYELEKISNVFEIIDPDTFVPSKTQAAINKTVREMEAAVEALESPVVPPAVATSIGGVND